MQMYKTQQLMKQQKSFSSTHHRVSQHLRKQTHLIFSDATDACCIPSSPI